MNKGLHLVLLSAVLVPSFVAAQSAPKQPLAAAEISRKSKSIPVQPSTTVVVTAKDLLGVWDEDKSNTLTADELPKVIGRSDFIRLDENANWVLTLNELKNLQAELDATGQLKKLHLFGIRVPLSDADHMAIKKARSRLLEAMKKRRLDDLGK
jgi:hypothetical protein